MLRNVVCEFALIADRWVTAGFVRALPASLDEQVGERGSRLSVLPVTPAQYRRILALEKAAAAAQR